MRIEYSAHSIARMRQRGIISLEVEYVIKYPKITRRISERIEFVGTVQNRTIKIVATQSENNIKIITVM